jgi:hypothetical protein
VRPTTEQAHAVDAFRAGGTLVIEAGAGSGKTSTLRMLANAKPAGRGLYLAYNKAIQTDAAASFPANVSCRTAHSLAYATHGAKMRHRLNSPRVPAQQVAAILRQHDPIRLSESTVLAPAAVASLALRTVERFCRSGDTEVSQRHFVPPEGVETAPGLGELRHRVTELAQRAWEDLTERNGQLRYTHDCYLKQWALSGPTLNYAYLLFDETQDADPAIASVVARQMTTTQVVCVGDAAQAIYGWRGATDFMSRIKADHRTRLSQSFRFGQAIADEANVWLDQIGTKLRLTGNPAIVSTIEQIDSPAAILCRTNAQAVSEVITAHQGCVSVALVGGGRDMKALAYAAEQLTAGRPASHPELIAFCDWDSVRHYAAHDPGGSDLATAVKLIDAHTPRGVIAAIDACTSEDRAQLVVSTAHKAKGREWATVRIAEDFPEPKPDTTTSDKRRPSREEAMLAYVAITRAKTSLDNTGLTWIHNDIYGKQPAAASAAAL